MSPSHTHTLKATKANCLLALFTFGTLSLACHGRAAASGPSSLPGAPLAAAPAPFDAPPVAGGVLDIPALVARVRPVVVNITVEETVTLPRFDFEWPFDFFRNPFGSGTAEPPPSVRRQAQGSGFIVDPRGYVVTNAHVVEGASVVRVRLADEREFRAKVKGRDSRLDLAVVELEGVKDLPSASLGSAETLRIGEYVIAVGNPFGLGHTVTMGIVSAKSRAIGGGPYDDFIQTDASINPGNSGGPLFNLRGEVIGINSAINPRGKGIGFAIPVDALKDVLPQLLSSGHVERGRLGVVIQPITWPLAKAFGMERPEGALVAEVEQGGPADLAGLKAGDVVVAVGTTRITRAEELPRAIARHAPGAKVQITILRDKRERSLDVKLDALAPERVDMPATREGESAGRLGIDASDAAGGGALIRRVAPSSLADGQLEPGDVVLEADHTKVESAEQFARILEGPLPHLLKVRRDGATRFVAIDKR